MVANNLTDTQALARDTGSYRHGWDATSTDKKNVFRIVMRTAMMKTISPL
jgi:hypothetical protein